MAMNLKTIINPLLLYYLRHYRKQRVFIRHLKVGQTMDKRRIMSLLIDLYIEYCGLSMGYRTVAYDLGWTVFNQYVEYEKTEFSRDESFF
jgi:hypothetical protein